MQMVLFHVDREHLGTLTLGYSRLLQNFPNVRE